MSDQSSQESLSDAFRRLGQNLTATMKAAAETPEAKRLRSEVEEGLQQFRAAINEASEEFRSSPTRQRLQEDVDELTDRLRSGELTQKARQELVHGLDLLNQELERAQARWSAAEQTQEQTEEGSDPSNEFES